MMNGSAPGAARRARRSAPGSGLSARQRLLISAVAAALGLLSAWAWSQRTGAPAQHSLAAAATGGDAGGGTTTEQPKHLHVKPQKQQQQAAKQHAAGGQHKRGGAAQQQQQHKPAGSGVAGAGGKHEAAGAGAAHAVVHVGMEDERLWFDKLSAQACSHVEAVRVCSHRGRVAPEEGVAAGSLPAYGVLQKRGIWCYDIDFILTSDGSLLATHPSDMQAAIDAAGKGGSKDMAARSHEHPLADIRAAGADEERFPTAETLIKALAASLTEAGLLWQPSKAEGAPDYTELPVLLMDLKGPAFTAAIINAIASVAESAAVSAAAHVALFTTTPQQLELVQQQTQWKGPLIKAYMDREDPAPLLRVVELAPFAMLGPSIKMADSFFAAASHVGKPVLAWTVDSPGDLHRAAEAGVSAVISNRPQVLRAVLLDWRDRCSERQRRQLQAHRALRGGAAVRQAQQEGQRQRQLQPGGWP
ncbi:glycerophosphodiester phosphodiesterase isoform A [Micractinium conductrix]|uniref:glycerophosphodiester phosphodiesterase n=1 Tax=Micractinium conductrix TaxID=554055 RepID=A0A2P6V0R3_9CHLO|nr:glycerophosphodiester phosphodiesterase isoform A [Micractinium conductrix]|eukprot:PSC67682.1 glycerophosphodiester phosphodiesterase isoform A [Micractinium conductrix]